VFSLKRMKLNDKLSASNNFINFCRKKYTDNPIVTGLLDLIELRKDDVIKNIGEKNEKEFTEALKEADYKRDDYYRSLFYILRGYVYKNEADEVEDGINKLWDQIEVRGLKFLQSSYANENIVLLKLIEVFEKDEFKPVIEKMNLIGIVENLKTWNTKFNKIFEDRLDAKDNRLKPLLGLENSLDQAIITIRSYLRSIEFDATVKTLFAPYLMVKPPAPKA
jgi:uncharacterized protein DUF6261